ncbi:MAG TPA: CopD family protein [Casimicrobiaceae bacterium]|nr:CopD family protein [Casimicrobiaceae bacterium]
MSEFAQLLLASLSLAGMAIAVGGVAFAGVVLRPDGTSRELFDAAMKRAKRIAAVGAIMLALARIGNLAVVASSYADPAAGSAARQLMSTDFARATLVQALAAFALAWVLASQRAAALRRRWLVPALLAAVVVSSGAWLTHAASRVEHATPLMLVTVLHQLAAAVWLGGLVQLALLWRLARRHPGDRMLWPRSLARFSPLALASVVLLIAAGAYLGVSYLGDWQALIGTGYGAMVLAKITLLGLALGLAALNFSAVRRWRANANLPAMTSNVPPCVEAEVAIVLCALLAAASLTTQAPAIDVAGERASMADVAAFFAPKRPTLRPPPRDAFLAVATPAADAFAVPDTLERRQNTFNHNLAGLLVLMLGSAAALDRIARIRLARHWPLMFLPLAAFVFLFAEPTVWPLGPESFWRTLVSPAVLQHRLAALLVVALALAEWRARSDRPATQRWRFAFPLLCIAGGAMLVTHAHTAYATRVEFLIELSHAALGLLAVMIGAGRWLDLRLPANARQPAGVLWSSCLIVVGFVLLFYREY